MSGNSFGKIFRVTTFGESHGRAVGVVVDGCPAGLEVAVGEIQTELDKRRPGQNSLATQRQEKDTVEILSGVFEGKTLGGPIALVVYNKDARLESYEDIKDLYRPGHADYTYEIKYGLRDWRGGGRASARETAARVAAGAIARKLLARFGVKIVGYVVQIGRKKISKIDEKEITNNILRCPDKDAVEKMIKIVERAKADGDSIGGIVEVAARGVPAGLGEPVFGKLSADLAKALVSMPAVKGFEIGDGFGCVARRGSENNDEWTMKGDKVGTKTNRSGGVIGGISTGEDIVVRIALKPASSIAKPQQTVNKDGQALAIQINGRHDSCVCPRAVPVAEAMVALVLADHYLLSKINKIW